MDIAPTTSEEAPIFASAKRYPDPVFGHAVSPQPRGLAHDT